MELLDILSKAVEMDGADIFIIPGAPVKVKVNTDFLNLTDERMLPEDTERLIREIYALARRDISRLDAGGDDDFSFAVRDMSRFRCNTYYQRGSLAAVCRVVKAQLPDPQTFHIPQAVMDLTEAHNGMILVTGPAGSGKSTTLACMVDQINRTRSGHIVTIEDPIEHLHRHQLSLVTQREVPSDAATFPSALRAALREAPDVIMLGEMRDLDTIRTAITAAETGHLLLSSLHTSGAAKTIDRIVDTFPATQQAQVRMQLSTALRAVVSQKLVPTTDKRRIAVFEVMRVTPAIQNLIRDGKTYQIDNAIHSGGGQGMISMDAQLIRLKQEGTITAGTAVTFAMNAELMQRRLNL